MEYKPIDEAVADIQQNLGFPAQALSAQIRRWIYEAISEIGISRLEIKTKEVDIIGYKATKPSGLVAAKSIHLKSSNTGACVEPWYSKNLSCCKNTRNCTKLPYTVSDSRESFCFSDNTDQFDTALIEYYSAPVDEDGKPLVPYFAWQAVNAYVDYTYLRRERRRHQPLTPSKENPVALTELDAAQRNWFLLLGEAQTSLVKPQNFRQALEIGHNWLYRFTNTWPHELNSCCRNFYLGL